MGDWDGIEVSGWWWCGKRITVVRTEVVILGVPRIYEQMQNILVRVYFDGSIFWGFTRGWNK